MPEDYLMPFPVETHDISERTKLCSRCNIEKLPTAFYKDAHKRDGLSPQCKECRALPPVHKNLEDRFWEKVNKTESCWLWVAALWPNGYGHFVMPTHDALAHRVAWEFTHGPIPEGMDILHNCPGGDRKSCVNPKHLWLGTQQDNAKDAVTKGQIRFLYGANHPAYGKRVTICKKGHPMVNSNIILQKNGTVRRCRICTTEYHRNYNKVRRNSTQPVDN